MTKSSQTKHQSPNLYTKISLISIITFLALFLGTIIISLIVKAILIDNSISETKNSVYLYADSSHAQIDPDEFKPELFQHKSTSLSSAQTNALKETHGQLLGTTTRYQLEKPVSVIDQSVIKDFLLPDIKPSKTQIPLALPSNMSEYHQSELDYLKKLAPDTDFIAIATVPNLDHVYLVDENSDKIADFLAAVIHLSDFQDYDSFSVTNSAIAKFDNFSSAKSYLKTQSSSHIATIVEVLFGVVAGGASPIGNTISIQNDFIAFYNIFTAVSFILLIITLFIVLFCLLAGHRQQPAQLQTQQTQPHKQSQKSAKRARNK